MNKKGFISVTVIYSFFMVFLMLLLLIVSNLVSNRTLLNSVKDKAKTDLNNAIFAKYLISNASKLNLVKHDETLEYGAMDNSYRYSNYYNLSEKAREMKINSIDNDLIKYYCEGELKKINDPCTQGIYKLSYDEKEFNTYNDALLNALNDNYITYEEVNNYVCLSENTENCSNDDLYRIIGVIDGKVKLIKDNFVTIKNENGEEINTFYYDNSPSVTNVYVNTTIYNYLNIYSNSFLSTLKDMDKYIDTTPWQVGGIDGLDVAYKIYDKELGIDRINDTVKAKIGLPYISDYAFSKDKNGFNGEISSDSNWLILNNSWLLTRNSTNYTDVYFVNDEGKVELANVYELKKIKPTLFLKENVLLKKGSGKINDPYIIG